LTRRYDQRDEIRFRRLLTDFQQPAGEN